MISSNIEIHLLIHLPEHVAVLVGRHDGQVQKDAVQMPCEYAHYLLAAVLHAKGNHLYRTRTMTRIAAQSAWLALLGHREVIVCKYVRIVFIFDLYHMK